MRRKVKPPQVHSSTLSSTAEIKAESLKNNPASEKKLNEDGVEKEQTLSFNNSSIENDEKKEPTKRVFAKRGEQNRSHSNCTPSFLLAPFSSSSTTTKTQSVSRLACNVVTATTATAASCGEALESIESVKAEIPEETCSSISPSKFESIADSKNNNNNQSDLKDLKATKSSLKSGISKSEIQSFCSSKYSVAGSQISLISNVMDRIEKGKNHLDESLASNR
uniref:Uncharacterized protein n=1 Tax=Panagrolaimus sp. ES5 TaxID=591445 RepID=A0AC34GVN0_9BILA